MDNISSLKIAVDSSEVKNATNNLNNLTGVSGKAEKTVNTLRNAFATIGAGALAKQFIDTADKIKLLDARLKLATDSTKEFKSQQEQLLKISLQSYTAYSDTVTLFTKLNPALKQVGASTEQVNSVVSSFVKGLQLGGSSAAEASSAILQFSQAMGSGVLRGEEFNAIAEASPKLMSYLAKGMGVAQGELRKMAENGELTASRVSNALLKVRDTIDKDFATLPVTVGKAMTNLATATSLMVQDVDNATGATQSLSNMIQEFTGNIDGYSKDIIKFFGDITLYAKENEKTLTQVEALVVGVASAYLAFVAGGAVVAGIGAITNAIVALRVSMLSLQASVPVLGWISAAVGVGAATYIANMDDITEATFRNIKSVEDAQKALDDLAIKRKAISDDKFMLDSEQKEKTKAIDKQTEAIQLQVMALREMKFERSNIDNSIIPSGDNSFLDKFKVNTNEKPLDELKTKRNEVEVIKLLGSEYQKFNLTLDERTKKAKELGATEKEINDFRNKEIKDFNEKQDKSIAKTKESTKSNDDLNNAIKEMSKVGLSDYSLAVQDITEKTQEWIKAGADYNEVIAKQKQLLEELNLQNSLSIASEQLSFLEKKAQLMTDEYEKAKLLLEIRYAQNLVDIQGRNIPIEDKQRLIEQETELYNLTKDRIELDRNAEFNDTLKNFQEDALERQIALNESMYEFGDSFDGIAKQVSAASKAVINMNTIAIKAKKEESKLNDKYSKEFLKYANDEQKTKELMGQYEKDQNQLKEENFNAQIAGWANLAGAMSSVFEAGSNGAKAFTAIQATLGIVSSLTAIAQAWASAPFPANIPAVAAATSALLPIIAQLSSLGGSSGGGGSGQSTGQKYKEKIEKEYAPYIDRLDTQIKLLEAIEKNGSAQSASVNKFNLTFEKDIRSFIGGKAPKYLRSLINTTSLEFEDFISKTAGLSSVNVSKTGKSATIDLKSFKDKETGITDFFNYISAIGDLTSMFAKGITDEAKQQLKYDEFITSIQDIIGEYALNMVDIVDKMKDASKTFKGIYDDITQTTKYADKELKTAFLDVRKLVPNINLLPNYLEKQINAIDKVSSKLNTDVYELLLSSKPEDFAKQAEAIKMLSDEMGMVFSGGAEDALNFVDSITKVGEALTTSKNNINTFLESFLNDAQKAEIMANKLGTTLPKSINELMLSFNKMANDWNGLTDNELDYLSMAKDLLNEQSDTLKDTINSLTDASTNLRNSVNGIDSNSLERFYQSMTKTQDLLSSGNYESIAKSINETIGLSSALNDTNNFALSRDMQYAQLVAAKQFEDMKDTLKDDVDYLSGISTNTANTNIAINDLSNTIKAYMMGKDISSFSVGVPSSLTNIASQITTPTNFTNGISNPNSVISQSNNMANSISNMGIIIGQNISNLENKLNDIIKISGTQVNKLNDIYDASNGSLVSLQNIEVII